MCQVGGVLGFDQEGGVSKHSAIWHLARWERIGYWSLFHRQKDKKTKRQKGKKTKRQKDKKTKNKKEKQKSKKAITQTRETKIFLNLLSRFWSSTANLTLKSNIANWWPSSPFLHSFLVPTFSGTSTSGECSKKSHVLIWQTFDDIMLFRDALHWSLIFHQVCARYYKNISLKII